MSSPIGFDDVADATRVLEALADAPALLCALAPEVRGRLLAVAGRLSRPNRDERRRVAKQFRRQDRARSRAHDEEALSRTGMREARRAPVFIAPPQLPPPDARSTEEPPELTRPRSCYVCKADYRRLHHFYDSMCPPCGDRNYAKRHQTAPLDGKVALVTGGRIKIGYQTVLLLLRAGARTIVTTRFPHDAARRFAAEEDFAAVQDRLEIVGLDLRHAPSVERFAAEVASTYDRLDVLVNNAAQTVRRPEAFYAPVLDREGDVPAAATRLLSAHRRLSAEGVLSYLRVQPRALPAHADPGRELLDFPLGRTDADLQQVDLRRQNSWRLTADEVPTVELLEVHLVNAVAPFLLASRLKPLMLRTPGAKHIVNVSAMEAQFARRKKTERHPHTNMAKAALNMLTRTSAADYAEDGIYMNSVDTGWVTDEDPLHHAARKQRVHGFHPPLDVVDGAARVLDPVFTGYASGVHAWGKFWKDYGPTDW